MNRQVSCASDRPVDQQRNNGRIDSPAQPGKHSGRADPLADVANRILHERTHPPIRPASAAVRGGRRRESLCHAVYGSLRDETEYRTGAGGDPPWRSSRSSRCGPSLTKPGGVSTISSPWLIQTRCVRGEVSNRGSGSRTSRSAGPYSRCGARTTLPFNWCAISCMP